MILKLARKKPRFRFRQLAKLRGNYFKQNQENGTNRQLSHFASSIYFRNQCLKRQIFGLKL